MNHLRLAPVMGAAFVFSANSVLAASAFYVDPSAALGGNGSLSTPFRTIAEVNAAQSGTATKPATVKDGDTVYFKCGTAWPASNETPTALQLKTGVTYDAYRKLFSTAYEGCGTAQKPILRGSVRLTGLSWTLVDTTTNTYSANVSVGSRITQLVDPSIDTATTPSQRLQRARYPNIGEGNYDNAATSRYLKIGPQTPGAADDQDTYTMQLTAKTGKGIPTSVMANGLLKGAQAFVHTVNWNIRQFTIADHQANSNFVTLKPSDPRDWKGETIRAFNTDGTPASEIGGFWLEDQKWMLDAPGEWYHEKIDSATGSVNKLYIVCAAGKKPSTTYYATIGNYGIVSGIDPDTNKLAPAGIANRFTLKNLEVQDTSWDGIAILGNSNDIYRSDTSSALWAVNSFTIDGVNVTRAGRHGIVVRAANGVSSSGTQAHSISITNSRIQYTLGAGLDLGSAREWDAGTDKPANWMPGLKGGDVTNNTLNEIGMDRFALAAIRVGGRDRGVNPLPILGGYNYVSGNTISKVGSRGIYISGINSTVRNNTITQSCLLLDDCGAIYTEASDGPYAMGLTVQNNTINTVGSIYTNDGLASNPMGSIGIYLDNATSGVTVDGNTVTGSDWGIDLHGTTTVTVSNNKVSQVRQAAIIVGQIGTTLSGNFIRSNTLSATGQAAARVISVVAGPPVTTNMVSLSNNIYSASNATPFEINWGRLSFSDWLASGLDSGSQLQ